MIYKIEFDLSQSIENIINAIEPLGNIFFSNRIIYISTHLDKRELLSILKENISDEEQIFVSSINEDNFNLQTDSVKSWCKGIFIEEDLKRLEREQQEKIKVLDKFLDMVEERLTKKGGD